MAELKSNRGIANVKAFCEEQGIRVHTAGFNDGDILELDSAETIVCRVKELNSVKYAELSCKVNNKQQFKSVGSLYRSYLVDDELVKPNDFKNLSDCLDALCGKKVKLLKIEGAKAYDYNDDTKIVPVTVFKVVSQEAEKANNKKTNK